MPNYREGLIGGYQRAKRVEITNPLNQIPSITFYEELVITGRENVTTIVSDVSTLTEAMTDPAVQFDLVNPETGAVIGSAAYQDIYVILYSLYMALAAKRDEGQ